MSKFWKSSPERGGGPRKARRRGLSPQADPRGESPLHQPAAGPPPRAGEERHRRRLALAGLLLLAACGKQQDLQPAAGRALPPKPLAARATPTVDQLLTRPTIADPERVDELLKKSEERRDDRFDLPPP